LSDTSKCTLAAIGGCSDASKGIQVHHRDGNPTNNEASNRVPLCPAHHRCVENGLIDLDDPQMPPFVIRGGKRRYLYRYSAMPRSE
jgi:hypothetical protein